MPLRTAICLLVLTLAGCGMRSFVVPVGNDTYAIKGSSATLTSGAEEKARLIKSANDYCRRSRTSAVVVASRQHDAKRGTLAEPGSIAGAEIEFRCE